jgi:UDP-GlcNAc3NAcA epimerase
MMQKIKIMTFVGARPQFVKAAALSPALMRYRQVEEMIIHTGQHFDANMSDVFFEEMSIPAPKINLGIGGGTHGQNTGRMIEAIEDVLLTERPDCVVVFGDTDSTLAAAIAAAKLGLMLVHIEAGLRSRRRAMPEEINRVLTDHVADVLYASSDLSKMNLHNEGVDASKVVVVGDVMCDVALRFKSVADAKSAILERLEIVPDAYNFMTMHRKENTDELQTLTRILDGLTDCDVPIVFPVHPRTKRRLEEFGLKLPNCILPIEPQGYMDTLKLISNARHVLTDSGGVQKEAYFLGRPCITLRDETEWVELVDIGANVLAGSDTFQIKQLLGSNDWGFAERGIYGDGHAAELIASDLVARLTKGV